MPKPIKIEIVQEGNLRFMVKTFADRSEERVPIVKLPRKRRFPSRPYWHWNLNKQEEGFLGSRIDPEVTLFVMLAGACRPDPTAIRRVEVEFGVAR